MEQGALCGIDFLEHGSGLLPPTTPEVRGVVKAIQHYLREPGVPIRLQMRLHGTPFQQSVWKCLQQIPAGRPLTYGGLAERLGTSARAVGNACRANPCPLVIPCHRVVGAAGLGGFAGQPVGERVAIKRWLLAHEGYSAAAS